MQAKILENTIPKGNRINHFLNYSLLVFAVLLPISRSAISAFIIIIPLLWIIEGDWKSKWEILKSDKLIILAASFIGFNLLSLLWTENFGLVPDSIKNYGHLILIPVILTSMDKEIRQKILYAFNIGILILLVLSVLNYYGVLKVFAKDRTANLFMHHLDYSMFLACSSLFGLLKIYENSSAQESIWIKENILWGAVVSMSTLWLFIQSGRSGQFAFIVTLIFFSYQILAKWNKRYFIIFLTLIVSLLLLQYKFNKKFMSRIDHAKYDLIKASEGYYNTSLGVRVVTNKIALAMVAESPWIGYGVGDGMSAFTDWIAAGHAKDINRPRMLKTIKATHFHNQYLQILAEVGGIGLLLFFSMFLYFYLGSNNKLGALVLIILFFTGFIAEPFFRNQFTAALISFFMAILYYKEDQWKTSVTSR